MKYCGNCGNQINDGVEFCPVCGTKVNNSTAPNAQQGMNAPQTFNNTAGTLNFNSGALANKSFLLAALSVILVIIFQILPSFTIDFFTETSISPLGLASKLSEFGGISEELDSFVGLTTVLIVIALIGLIAGVVLVALPVFTNKTPSKSNTLIASISVIFAIVANAIIDILVVASTSDYKAIFVNFWGYMFFAVSIASAVLLSKYKKTLA